MRRAARLAVNAALSLATLAFLALVTVAAAGHASGATSAPPHRTVPTVSPTTAPPPPTTSPPPASTAPPTTSPPPASTAPPATTPTSRTPRATVPLRGRTTPTPGGSTLTPLLPAATVATTTTTSTTIAALGGRLPPAPVTLPLTTKSSNGHVDPLFAWLSGIGFLVALLIMAGRFIVTWPRRPRAGTEGRS